MKNLPDDIDLMQSFTGLHSPTTHPNFTSNRELVGARPLHLANARPFGRLKAPLGLSLLRCAAQTRICRGEAPPSCLRKTVRSLKSPTGAFIATLRKRELLRIRYFRQLARKKDGNFGKKREGWTVPALLWVTVAL